MGVTTEIIVSLPRLHAGQERRRQQIAAHHARFVVTMCGRRWGKSTDGGEWLADGAIEGEPCALFTPTYKYLAEMWRELSSRLRPFADCGGKINEQEKRIELPNGGLIDCWSMDTPDPGRGRKYKRVVIDEAGLVRGLLPMWTNAIRPTLVDLQGDAWFYGTPKGRLHDFSVLFGKGESGDTDWLSFRAPTRDNPYIPADEIEAARRDMPSQAFAQEFEGIPADDGGNPFGLSAIQSCTRDQLGDGDPVVWGWDFARAQDWTVGVGLNALGDVVRLERWQLVPWGETMAQVTAITGKITPAYGDSTGIGDVVVEGIQRSGVRMQGVHFSRPEKQQLMERLASAIQRGTITFPRGVLTAELETFQYEYYAGGVRYSSPEGLHDDCVMALALAVKGLPPIHPVRKVPLDESKSMPYDYDARMQQERPNADKLLQSWIAPVSSRALVGRNQLPRRRR